MSTAVATVKAHTDKNKKKFDVVLTFLTKYIDKQGPTPSVTFLFIA